MALKPLTHGQMVMIQINDPAVGNIVCHVEKYAGEFYGQDYYDIPVNKMFRIPRDKIWDFDINADNCRGRK